MKLSNAGGECESTANLVVQSPAPKETIPNFVQRISDQRTSQNSTIKFTCQINSSPRPTISWFKVINYLYYTFK